MPRDVSSSSSEDEADDAVEEPSVPRTEKKTTRFQCPADFVTLSHKPCSSTLMESLRNNNNDLWLIKAPASFNPECFSGMKMKLSGLQTLKVPSAGKEASSGSGQQIFSVLTSNHGTSELRLLTSDKQSSDSMVFGPAFAGLVNMCESFGGSGASQPHVIPAAPAPTIPPGLKQRFQPFGSKTPKLAQVAGSEVDGAAFGPSSTSLRPLVVKHFAEEAGQEEEEGSKKKKKKKKDKRIKTESTEEQTRVKQEPSQEILEEMVTGATFEEGHVSEEKKKKRKKKDREAAEPSLEVKVEPDMVKRELIDSSYGDVDETPEKKKKKKKKRSKTEDD